jgi:hypothetical protein
MWSLRIAIAAVALVLAGCSGGDADKPAQIKPRADFSKLTENDLALMPLPAAALGAPVRGMAVDSDASGSRDARAAAADSIDPNDTAADIERRGRLAGYDLTYVDPYLTAAGAPRGFLAVATGVELFDAIGSAAATLEKNVRDYERLVGTEVEPGVRLTRADARALRGVGADAHLIVSALSTRTLTLHATVALFRVNTVLAGVVVGRADGRSTTALTTRLARALARRIRGVAAGDLTGKPVPIPPSERRSRTPPAGAGGLERLALWTADLPRGARVVRQEWVQQGRRVRFAREFAPVTVGRSVLLRLESDVERTPDAPAARAAIEQIAALMAQGASQAVVQAPLGPTAARDRVRLRRLDATGIGDRAIAVQVRVGTSGADTLEVVFVYVAVGRALGQLHAIGGAGALHAADVLVLARRFARRMGSG